MKLPVFDHKEQRWDQWKEFHVTHGGGRWGHTSLFTQFTTGELICTSHFRTSSGWGNSHNSRGVFNELGLRVFQLNDNPDFLKEGKGFFDPWAGSFVKNSWMPQAVPLLWDWDCNRVVTVSSHNKDSGIPTRFHNLGVTVYWAGEGRVPQGGGPVYYKKPIEWTKEERREARAVVNIIKAQARVGAVQGLEKGWWRGDRQVGIKELLTTPLAEMSDELKCRVIKFGTTVGYKTMETAFLEVRDA